jgi:hypothetical protein
LPSAPAVQSHVLCARLSTGNMTIQGYTSKSRSKQAPPIAPMLSIITAVRRFTTPNMCDRDPEKPGFEYEHLSMAHEQYLHLAPLHHSSFPLPHPNPQTKWFPQETLSCLHVVLVQFKLISPEDGRDDQGEFHFCHVASYTCSWAVREGDESGFLPVKL